MEKINFNELESSLSRQEHLQKGYAIFYEHMESKYRIRGQILSESENLTLIRYDKFYNKMIMILNTLAKIMNDT